MRPKILIFAGLILVVHAGLAVHSLWQKSVSYDELAHLPAGLAAVRTGEIRLNPEHPPLVKLLAGGAASTLRPRLPLDGEAYRRGEEWEFGRQVLFRMGNDDMGLLRRGRLPVVVLSVLGGVLVFLWSQRRYGEGAGLLSLSLYAFCPTVLAHGRWVTMDGPMAAFYTLTLYLWWLATRKEKRWAAAASGLTLGLSLATKFSGLILLPALAATDLLANGLRRSWKCRLAQWGILLTMAAGVLHAAYLFPQDPLRYFRDLQRIYTDVPEDYSYYLAGEFRQGGFPHYFLVAMGVKTALPGLLAMVAGLGLAAVRRREWREDLYLWLPALLWIAVTSVAAINIGVRYVVPAYPLLFILAGSLARELVSLKFKGGRLLVVLLALAQGSEALAAHPDYIPYFNRLAGGSRNGPHWLDDSNIDWGQDLIRLPGWLREKGIDRVRLLYFGTGDPAHYGVRREPFLQSDWWVAPRPGAYVVSAHLLVRGLLLSETRGLRTDWLRRYRPADVLGGTLYLYIFEPPTEPEESQESQKSHEEGEG